MRDQKEVGEEQRQCHQPEDLPLVLLLLIAEAGPLHMVVGGQFGSLDQFEEPLGADAWCRLGIEFGAGHFVVTGDLTGSDHVAERAERTQGNHFAVVIRYLDLADVVQRGAVVRGRLNFYLVIATEKSEVVDVDRSKFTLKRRKDRTGGDAERLRLLAVDVEEELRRVGVVGGHGVTGFRPAGKVHREFLRQFRKLSRIDVADAAELERGAASCAESHDGWRSEGDDGCVADGPGLLLNPRHDRIELKFRRFALIPGVQPKNAHRHVFTRAGHHAASGDHHGGPDSRNVGDPREELLEHRVGAVDRGSLRQFDVAHDLSLVLRGKE